MKEQKWNVKTLPGISKSRKWTFDTTSSDTLVSCFTLSIDTKPTEIISLVLEGEKRNLEKEQKKTEKENFDPNIFMRKSLKVDVKFDKNNWYCGEVVDVGNVMIKVKYKKEEDPDTRLKPKYGEIRLCNHSPQLTTPTL